MTLIERIKAETQTAQKAGDQRRLDVLRFLSAQVQNREIELRSAGIAAGLASRRDAPRGAPGAVSGPNGEGSMSGRGRPLTDDEVSEVLRKEAKKRREAIELFKKGGRPELAAKEEGELAIIATYLPAGPTREEIERVVDGVIARGVTGFSAVMREAMKELKGRADGSAVADVVKAKAK